MNPRSVVRFLLLLNPRRRYHRAEIRFAERIPAKGGALLVSNHGRLDFDCFILATLILKSRSRVVRLLGDHLWFKMPGVRSVWTAAGAVDGTRENAIALLEAGELVLAYPGGVREIMMSKFGRETLAWEGRLGFAAVAVATGVPVIPVAGIGVNNGHVFISSGRRLGRLLFQRLLRLGPAYADYRDPLTIGLIPLPLPFSWAVHLPWPCKLRYIVGEPVHPGALSEGGADHEAEAALAERVRTAMERLLAERGTSTRQ
jgi:1-acyl-sn-glycerol-3-phosphate acyltransferase